mmetsp:Transcript_8549/g.20726  ORF Transcript_8549/g.20726 Transcript_8549/m.20726 type:complete len:260 (+) Transcript_8549:1349-2128(+)
MVCRRTPVSRCPQNRHSCPNPADTFMILRVPVFHVGFRHLAAVFALHDLDAEFEVAHYRVLPKVVRDLLVAASGLAAAHVLPPPALVLLQVVVVQFPTAGFRLHPPEIDRATPWQPRTVFLQRSGFLPSLTPSTEKPRGPSLGRKGVHEQDGLHVSRHGRRTGAGEQKQRKRVRREPLLEEDSGAGPRSRGCGRCRSSSCASSSVRLCTWLWRKQGPRRRCMSSNSSTCCLRSLRPSIVACVRFRVRQRLICITSIFIV